MELLLAAQPAEPVLERLDPPKRTFAIMAIIFIAIMGLLLVTCTMLGARWVRRVARQKPRPPRMENGAPPAADNRTLHGSPHGMLRKVDSSETIHLDRELGETKVDP
ncbi:MAG: hypothetical protein WD468_09500 [Pirellulales bacterium]